MGPGLLHRPTRRRYMQILVEKKIYMNGQTAGYGKILAAEYINAGHPYQAVLFHDANGAPAYYKPDAARCKKRFYDRR